MVCGGEREDLAHTRGDPPFARATPGLIAVRRFAMIRPIHPVPQNMNITLSPQIAAAVAGYAKIIGCSESEFLNRYLEDKLSETWNEDHLPALEAMDECLADFTFKSRDEAQRVLDWFCSTSKATALKDGDQIRIRTEIAEMSSCYSDYLSSQGLETVFMVRAAVCYVNRENQPISFTANDNVGGGVEKPKYHWSDEA
jgi:hypothetical protein